MIPVKIRNWHKRNQFNAHEFDGSIICCGQNATAANGGAYFQLLIHDERPLVTNGKGRIVVTMSPNESQRFLAEVQHCARNAKPEVPR